MKICILGDTHFGARGDSLDFHKYFEKFYRDILFPYLKENNIKVSFKWVIYLTEESSSISIHCI